MLLLRWHFLSVSWLLRVVQPGSRLQARALHLLHTLSPPTPTGPEVLIVTSTGHGDVSSLHTQREGSFLTSHSSQVVLIAQSQVCTHKTGLPSPSHLCSHTRRTSGSPPELFRSKRQQTCTAFSFTFWRCSIFSTTHHFLAISTAQELDSHYHSHP